MKSVIETKKKIDTNKLRIYLVEAVGIAKSDFHITNLIGSDSRGKSDPKCFIYMNNIQIGTTKTVSNTLNPVWNDVYVDVDINEILDEEFKSNMTVEVFDMGTKILKTKEVKSSFLGMITLSKEELKSKIEDLQKTSLYNSGNNGEYHPILLNSEPHPVEFEEAYTLCPKDGTKDKYVKGYMKIRFEICPEDLIETDMTIDLPTRPELQPHPISDPTTTCPHTKPGRPCKNDDSIAISTVPISLSKKYVIQYDDFLLLNPKSRFLDLIDDKPLRIECSCIKFARAFIQDRKHHTIQNGKILCSINVKNEVPYIMFGLTTDFYEKDTSSIFLNREFYDCFTSNDDNQLTRFRYLGQTGMSGRDDIVVSLSGVSGKTANKLIIPTSTDERVTKNLIVVGSPSLMRLQEGKYSKPFVDPATIGLCLVDLNTLYHGY